MSEVQQLYISQGSQGIRFCECGPPWPRSADGSELGLGLEGAVFDIFHGNMSLTNRVLLRVELWLSCF